MDFYDLLDVLPAEQPVPAHPYIDPWNVDGDCAYCGEACEQTLTPPTDSSDDDGMPLS